MKELARIISKKTGKTISDSESFLAALQDVIEGALLQNENVKVGGLGTFKLVWNKPRKSVDVTTGEEIEIQGHTKLSFTPESSLKDFVNKPFSHLETVALANANEAEIESSAPEEPLSKLIEQAVELSSLLKDINTTDEPQMSIENDVQSEQEVVDEDHSVAEQNQYSQEETIIEEDQNNIESKSVSPEMQEETAVVEDKPNVEAEMIEQTQEKTSSTNIYGTSSLYAEEDVPVKKSRKALWVSLLIIFILSILSFGVYYCYHLDYFNQSNEEVSNKETVVSVEPIQEERPTEMVESEEEEIELTDDVVAEPSQSSQPTQEVIDSAQVVIDINAIRAQHNSSFGNAVFDEERIYTEFIDEVKLTNGNRLAAIARKYLGHASFWVYVYEANMDRISNPNNIKIGTMIKVPKLKQQLIDSRDEMCVKYAKELHEFYVNKRK